MRTLDGESDEYERQNGKERQAELEVEEETEEEETEEEDMETDNEDENQEDMDTEHQCQITQANNMEFTVTRSGRTAGTWRRTNKN